jgi:amino acid adenylation domain-containing protein
MTLLAAFQILLAKYSGQTDIAVGAPIAGRGHSELEGLIGLFVNTIVLRTSLDSDPTLREILCRTRETALGAYAHQDLPFERIIEQLQPARDPSRSPLFQVMFIFQQAGRGEEEIRGLTWSRVEVDVTSAKFDLTLSVLDSPTGVRGVIEYNPDLFNRDRIRRMTRHFKMVLEAMLENPNQRFSTLVLLNHNERKRVLGKWNATQEKYPPGQNLTKLFEAQAELTPERVAFIEEDRLLTYGELNRRANRLARRLRRSGCGEGAPVAICARRSLDMMVGILAVVKAGGLYLPIDPKMPNDRIAFMLGDAGARVVLTEDELVGRVTQSGAEVIRLDADWPEVEAYDHSNLGGEATGESALYLVYTSGSTGRPKGVVGTHGGTINRLRWMWDRFPFQDREVCCLKTSLSFVDSVWECFGPLLAGAPGVLIPDSIVNDADLLISYLGQRQVSRIVLVPSLLDSLLAREPNLGAFLPALKVWVCSGEALSSVLAERFHDAVPAGRLINLYGCSEVAGDVTFHLVGPVRHPQQIPIGRPVSNTQIYILDENMNPCGIGLQGEIYVGGAHLARGYWNRPDETATRFVPSPFAPAPGQRLYKTGDLGRFMTDGEVEYLGRIDDQVKVRGYRVESGEVESVLARHPNVRTVKVLAMGDGPYDKKLVAYVALVEAGEGALRRLRDYAAGFLPSYMLPSAYVQLERFSWLPNGKVDRRSLPAVDRSHTLSANAAAPPSTPDEAALVEIWRETLGLDRVGIHDNFFDLGGHSLALAQVRTRIESRLGWRVSLLELFTHPTISAFCAHRSRPEESDNLLEEARRRSALQQKAFQRTRRHESGAFLGAREKADWPVASIEE